MSSVLQESMLIYGYDRQEWSEVLLDMISSDQIPTQYGGTKTHIPISSRNSSDGIWNWNNPLIERILQQARGYTSVRNEGCQIPNSYSIARVDVAINEVISQNEVDHNNNMNLPLPTQDHAHRHGHGHDTDHEKITSKPDSESGTIIHSSEPTPTARNITFSDDELENTISQENVKPGISDSDISDKSRNTDENITLQPEDYENTTENDIKDYIGINRNDFNSDNDFIFEITPEENDTNPGHDHDHDHDHQDQGNGCGRIANLELSFVLGSFILPYIGISIFILGIT